MMRKLMVGAVAMGVFGGLSVMVATPAQALTGFANGSFETPVITPNSFVNVGAGSTIGAWTVSEGNVDLIGAGFWQAADGVQSLDLDGSAFPLAGAVTQTFSTLPLFKYRVAYKLAGNPASGPTIKTGQVIAGDSVIQSFSFDITGKSFTDMGYVGKTTYFIATNLSTTLTFRSTTGSGFGPVIDKVRVESCLLVICLG
jgi:choice-of-anchor C domain-containing protein